MCVLKTLSISVLNKKGIYVPSFDLRCFIKLSALIAYKPHTTYENIARKMNLMMALIRSEVMLKRKWKSAGRR